MTYSKEEIEYTLKLYSIAKLHLKEIEREILKDGKGKENFEFSNYNYYSHIIFIVDKWLETLFLDEIEIIKLRVFKKKSFDYISILLGYANHSSVVRKYERIIYKISNLQEI